MTVDDVFDSFQITSLSPDAEFEGLTEEETILLRDEKTDIIGVLGDKGVHLFEKCTRQWLTCQKHLEVN